uniref:Rdx_0 protein n=1 Tax=Fopius arisanus TaxID=64838 RepID=A0A0C9R8J8_9HYME
MGSSKGDDWTYTRKRTEETKYKWTIKDFSTIPQKCGDKIQSPSFFTEDGEREWKLAFYPSGCNLLHPDSVGLFVTPLMPEDVKFKIELTLAIFTPEEMIRSRNCFIQWKKDMPDWGYQCFIKRSELLSLKKSNDSIIIHCDMRIYDTAVVSAFDNISSDLSKSLKSQKRSLINDFRSLFTDPQFSDFRIIVGNEIFHVHKNILAARSSTFAVMFKHEEMEENRKNEVKIENMDSELVKGMLEYIYTSEVQDLERLACGLLGAAEQYDLGGLKNMCMDTMYNLLTAENAADILVHADLYRISRLKEDTINFIKEHLTEVQSTESFRKISNAGLLMELLLAIGKQDGKTNKTDEKNT